MAVVPGKWQCVTKKKGEVYTHVVVIPAVTWPVNISDSLQMSCLPSSSLKLLAFLQTIFYTKYAVLFWFFSPLQVKSYLKSTMQVQEGIFSVARVLLKMEILTVDQHVPLP